MAIRNLSSSCVPSWLVHRAHRLARSVAAVVAAMGFVASSAAVAQTTTPVPASALTTESWMTAGSVSVQSPTSALVGQNTNGFRWDVSFFVDASNNPDIYNAIKTAATNGGSLDYTVRFDPSLIVVPGTQPTFIGVNSFYQTGGVTNNFIQNYNLPILGSADFPLTGERTFDMSLPIAPWTDPTVPVNNTGSAYFEPAGTWYKVGFGLNFDNASSAGFYLENVAVTAVPEPASFAVGGAAIAAIVGLRLRRRSGSRSVPKLDP